MQVVYITYRCNVCKGCVVHSSNSSQCDTRKDECIDHYSVPSYILGVVCAGVKGLVLRNALARKGSNTSGGTKFRKREGCSGGGC